MVSLHVLAALWYKLGFIDKDAREYVPYAHSKQTEKAGETYATSVSPVIGMMSNEQRPNVPLDTL